jgi:hypothetical protein
MSVEWELEGETEVFREHLHPFHFVHHKSHMIWPGIEPATNRLRYGTAKEVSLNELKNC